MQEQLSVALLDTQLNVIGWEVVFVGTLSQVQTSPREDISTRTKSQRIWIHDCT